MNWKKLEIFSAHWCQIESYFHYFIKKPTRHCTRTVMRRFNFQLKKPLKNLQKLHYKSQKQ